MYQRKIIPDKIDPKIWKQGKGNWDDIILYALNGYGPLNRNEFINKPGENDKINKNTFHSHIKDLIDKGLVKSFREGKHALYNITSAGENEFLPRLADYKLDFDTIFKIEEKKSKNLINRFSEFFKDNRIDDNLIKLEYIKLGSIITQEKVKGFFSEEKFNKLLLFLVLNHPKFYPKYNISIEDFTKKYNLHKAELEMFILKVIDEKIYNITFHKLKTEPPVKELYFIENSEYGEIFKTTVDNNLKDLVLLKSLGVIELNYDDLEHCFSKIVNVLVDKYKLFPPELGNSLLVLIDNYRKEIKKQMIKKVADIAKYAGLIGLPERLEQPRLPTLTESEKVHEKYIERFKIEQTKTDQPLGIIPTFNNYNTFRESFKDVKYFSKENLIRKAWDLYDRKDYDGTLEQINKIIQIETNPEMLYWKAEILGFDPDLKKYDEALEAIENGIKINPMPSGYNFYRLKAEILYKLGKYEESLVEIDKALSIDKQLQIFKTKVDILIKLKQYNNALDLSIRHNIYSKEELSQKFRIEAKDLEKLNRLNLAMKAIQIAIYLEPKKNYNLLTKASILTKLKQYRTASETIDEAIKIDNYDIYNEDYLDIATILKDLKRYDEAFKYIDLMIENDSIVGNYIGFFAYELKLSIFEEIKSIDEILKLYDDAINEFPKSPLCLDKGIFLKKIKRYEESLNILDDCIKFGFNNTIIEKVDIYIVQSRYNEALNLIEESIKTSKFVDIYETLIKKKIDIYAFINNFQEIKEVVLNINLKEPQYILLYPYAAEKLIDNKQYQLAKDIMNNKSLLRSGDEIEIIDQELSIIFYHRLIDNIRNEEYSEALQIIENFMNYDNREDPQIFEYKISALQGLEKYKEALETVNYVINKWPKYLEIRPIDERKNEIPYGYKFCNLKAQILMKMGKYEESLEIIEKILKHNSKIPLSYRIKAINEMYLENYEEALKSINQAITLEPNKLISHQLKSNILYELHRFKEALITIEECFKIDSNSSFNYDLKSKILLFSNRIKEALEIINKGIVLFPENSELYNTKSFILDTLYDYEGSLKEIEKAEELGEDISYYNKAQLLLNLGRYEKALVDINKFIKEQPNDPQALEVKALALANLNEFDEALQVIDKAIELNPPPPPQKGEAVFITLNSAYIKLQIYKIMALFYAKKGEKEQSIEYMNKAIELDPEESVTYDLYGEILMMFEDYEGAKKQLEKAKELDFTPIETYIKLGKCLFELGQYKEALENLKRGKYEATYRIQKQIITEDGKKTYINDPQVDLIQEAEQLISKIEKDSKPTR